MADLACSDGDLIALSCQRSGVARVYILQIEQMDVALKNSWEIVGESSCLMLARLGVQALILLGSVSDVGDAMITVFNAHGQILAQKAILPARGKSTITYEAFAMLGC